MKRLTQYGFTLIELLVVIAIIGILAAVVLASLSDARDGAQDAGIAQSMANLRSQAELHYNQEGLSYEDFCESPRAEQLLESAASNVNADTVSIGDASTPQTPQNGNDGGSRVLACNDSDTAWAAASPLTGGEERYWCVDSTGVSEEMDFTEDGDTRNGGDVFDGGTACGV